MKKIKKLFKIKYIICLLAGVIISSAVMYSAATIYFNSDEVSYSGDILSGTNVKDALDELYIKIRNHQCKNGFGVGDITDGSYRCYDTSNANTITFNANGGTFSNGLSTNTVSVVSIPGIQKKYSYTENLDSSGTKISDYGNNWTNANIIGTDRGDTTKAHVITFPDATSLHVTITYGGEGTSC